MAVAVKNVPETASSNRLNRLAVGSLAGTVYVLASLVVVFYAIPALWSWGVHMPEHLSFVGRALEGLLLLAAAVACVWLGRRLLGPAPPHGLRAGVVAGVVGLALIALVTAWVGMLLENWFYRQSLFGSSAPALGAGITGLVGLVLLGLGVRALFRPRAERFLGRVEDQGWFSLSAYKRTQGLRVRRGTILGILLIVGCGIFTMLNHRTLDAAGDAKLSVPFTGQETIDSAGDVVKVTQNPVRLPFAVGDRPAGSEVPGAELKQVVEQAVAGRVTADRFAVHDFNEQAFKDLVRVDTPGGSKYSSGDLVPKADFDARVEGLKDGTPPTARAPEPAGGPVAYQSLTLLPSVRYTVPLLLTALAVWFAFRVVNYPTFADFLIATEAELNKVSWTSGRRLRQDTVVVLVTVVLLTVFLFVVDMLWVKTMETIGVIRIPTTQEATDQREQPW